MNLVKKLYLVVYIFFFLFAPPFIPKINMSLILGTFSFLILIFKYPKKTINLYKTKDMMTLLLLLFIYFAMYFISFSVASVFMEYNLNDNFIINMYSLFLNFVITFICSTYLVIKTDEYGFTKEMLIRYILYATCLQVLIALLSLTIPAFKSWTLSKMLKDNNVKLISSPWITSRRFYGFSNNLLDLFGFGVGIISMIPLFYSNKDVKKFLYSPIILILAVLNSRSGIVIFLLGLIVFIWYMLKTKKISFSKLVKTTVLLFILISIIYSLVAAFSPNTISWIKNDFSSFFSSDSDNGTATAIYSSNFWTIPSDARMILGAGFNVSAYSTSRVENIVHSDCGYINEIWKVGFVGLALYLLINIYIIKKCIDYEDDIRYKYMYIAFLIGMLAFLVKATLNGYNPGNVVIYTMFVKAIYQKKKEVDYDEKKLS